MYKENRNRFMERIADGVAILPAHRLATRSNNMSYKFRQNSNFYYLTGFPEPEAVCVLAPNHKKYQFILFVLPKDQGAETWDGKRVGVANSVSDFGADVAFPINSFDEEINQFVEDCSKIYYAFGDSIYDDKVVTFITQNRRNRASQGTGPKSIVDPTDIFAEMRLIKNGEEIKRVRRAAEITAQAHIKAMKLTKPGIYEYQVEAMMDSVFRKVDDGYAGYNTIIASGGNATILHYTDNNKQIEDGDLVLIDAGCEHRNYNGDVTRTFPASGKFTEPQRVIYQVVLEVQMALIQLIQPGTKIDKLNHIAIELLTEGMIRIGLLNGKKDKLIEKRAYRKFYMHGIGHPIGLDVHDVCRIKDGETFRTFQPGMITTVEPGIYVAADSEEVPDIFLGIGVRIEDDVLVTEEGHEVLTDSVPKKIEDIENLMANHIPSVSTNQ